MSIILNIDCLSTSRVDTHSKWTVKARGLLYRPPENTWDQSGLDVDQMLPRGGRHKSGSRDKREANV